MDGSRFALLHSTFIDGLELLGCDHRVSTFRRSRHHTIVLFLDLVDFRLASELLPVITLLGHVHTPVDFMILSTVMVHVAGRSESLFASCAVPAVRIVLTRDLPVVFGAAEAVRGPRQQQKLFHVGSAFGTGTSRG